MLGSFFSTFDSFFSASRAMRPIQTLQQLRGMLRYNDCNKQKWYTLCDHIIKFGKDCVVSKGLPHGPYVWRTHGAVLETASEAFYSQFEKRYWPHAFIEQTASKKRSNITFDLKYLFYELNHQDYRVKRKGKQVSIFYSARHEYLSGRFDNDDEGREEEEEEEGEEKDSLRFLIEEERDRVISAKATTVVTPGLPEPFQCDICSDMVTHRDHLLCCTEQCGQSVCRDCVDAWRNQLARAGQALTLTSSYRNSASFDEPDLCTWIVYDGATRSGHRARNPRHGFIAFNDATTQRRNSTCVIGTPQS
ncbi:hypothetical protein EJ07DRAFT_159379 [Lizonia empirigonia]|nr:hypothetical protein EJ07DRAFT_159379 [Lizonia empirigonia]